MIAFWNVRNLLGDTVCSNPECLLAPTSVRISAIQAEYIGLSEIRWWHCGEHSPRSCVILLPYPYMSAGGKRESGVALILPAITKLLESVSGRILTARFRFRIRNISIRQCYAPTEIFNAEEKEAFYKHLNATRRGLLKVTLRLWKGIWMPKWALIIIEHVKCGNTVLGTIATIVGDLRLSAASTASPLEAHCLSTVYHNVIRLTTSRSTVDLEIKEALVSASIEKWLDGQSPLLAYRARIFSQSWKATNP